MRSLPVPGHPVYRLLALAFAVLLLPLSAHAGMGPSDGGGGGAFVRYDRLNRISEAELLDLWEGRKRPPYYNIPYTNEPVDVQLERAMAKLELVDPVLAQRTRENLKYVRANVEDLDPDVTIEPPADARNKYGKRNWPLHGMMYFDEDTGRLSRKPEIFGVLINKTQEAASWMHEALYKSLRENIKASTYAHEQPRSPDSTMTRKLNACLFATDDCFELAKIRIEVPNDRLRLHCVSPLIDFRVFLDPEFPNEGTVEPMGDRFLHLKYVITRLENFVYQRPLTATAMVPARGGYSGYSEPAEPTNPYLTKFDRLPKTYNPGAFFKIMYIDTVANRYSVEKKTENGITYSDNLQDEFPNVTQRLSLLVDTSSRSKRISLQDVSCTREEPR